VPGLHVAQVDGPATFRRRAYEQLRDRFTAVFDLLGADPLDAEEFTELPGAEAFALLDAVRQAPDWDTVIVDLPHVRQAIALLALPEQLRRYLARLLPAERQAARALRPMLAQLVGVPMPAQWLYETAARWDAQLAGVQALIKSEATTVRLVLEPGPTAERWTRTARTGLALHGHRLEAVIANRLMPTGSADPFLAGLSGQQQEHLKVLAEECAGYGLEVCELAHLGRDPRGLEDLAELAMPALVPDARTDRPADEPWSVEDRLEARGDLVWRLPLPGATRDGLDLVRRGDELVVDVAGFRRILPLPAALGRCTVSGAALRDGTLHVRFTPDPQLWPG
jgi:arsenite-transporting ATPase